MYKVIMKWQGAPPVVLPFFLRKIALNILVGHMAAQSRLHSPDSTRRGITSKGSIRRCVACNFWSVSLNRGIYLFSLHFTSYGREEDRDVD
jgi:hypothetical protein